MGKGWKRGKRYGVYLIHLAAPLAPGGHTARHYLGVSMDGGADRNRSAPQTGTGAVARLPILVIHLSTGLYTIGGFSNGNN
jgi:hypothetical protein